MQLLRTLVVSALFCASAASAATIPVDSWAGEKEIEITIKIHHGQPIADGAGAGVSEQLVISIIIWPLSSHSCVYTSSTLSSLTTKPFDSCSDIYCVTHTQCPHEQCSYCDRNVQRVSFNFRKSIGLTNMLMSINYSVWTMINETPHERNMIFNLSEMPPKLFCILFIKYLNIGILRRQLKTCCS